MTTTQVEQNEALARLHDWLYPPKGAEDDYKRKGRHHAHARTVED